jgi:hypothetical protein
MAGGRKMAIQSGAISPNQRPRHRSALARPSPAALLLAAGVALSGCSQSHATAATFSPTFSPLISPTVSPLTTPVVTLGETPLVQSVGKFHLTGSMGNARGGNLAIRLNDGHVLIVGGGGPMTIIWPELYDPATGEFAPTGKISNSLHDVQTATLLRDGRVLIVDFPDAELYDPKTSQFSPTGSMLADSSETSGHYNVRPFIYSSLNATLLADGRVLMTAASDGSMLESSPGQLYDPRTGKFQVTSTVQGCAYGDTATLLQDGRVLIVGGREGQASLYDPKTGLLSSIGPMAPVRYGHTATLLKDDRVLLVGGTPDSGGCLSSAELFDPRTDKFSPTGSLLPSGALGPTDSPIPFCGDGTALLEDGRVFVAGWDSAQLYDPKTGEFSAAGSMTTARSGCSVTLLKDGRVLLAGGAGSGILASAEIYTP